MLTSAQKTTLKAAIDANQTWAAYPNASDGWNDLAIVLNQFTADFVVWATDVPVNLIFDAITWKNFTPVDTPSALDAALFTARAAQCQGQQFNLQIMVQGQTTINGSRSKIRDGLKDALQNILSGASGATKDAGWSSVQTALQRFARTGEKILSTGTGTAQSPATMGFEGQLSAADVEAARTS